MERIEKKYTFAPRKNDGISIHTDNQSYYYPVAGLALKAGLQPGFLVNKDDMDDAKTVDLSIPVGLSHEYQGIVLDARYNIGVTKIADNVDHYNNVIQITLGYKFSL